jgi:hypothetical protein
MSKNSHFESRTGNPDCTPEEIYYFVTDLRNFKRFVPEGTITDWKADSDSCSFTVPRMGDVELAIVDREKDSHVTYRGNALGNNKFELILHITRKPDSRAGLKVALDAELNPMMKMIASGPIGQFLDMVVDRMENFNCRQEIRE